MSLVDAETLQKMFVKMGEDETLDKGKFTQLMAEHGFSFYADPTVVDR